MKLVLFIIALVITICLAVKWDVFGSSGAVQQANGKVVRFAKVAWGKLSMLVISLVAFMVILSGWVIVPSGYTGVVVNMFTGTSVTKYLPEGSHVVFPVVTNVVHYMTRLDNYTMSIANGEGERDTDDSLWSPTKDGLQVGLDVTVLFYPDPKHVGWIHKYIGPEYKEEIVRPEIRSVGRMVVRNYTAVEVYSTKRDQIQAEIQASLREELAKKKLVVDKVLLRDVAYTQEYQQAISQKLIAQQEAQKMDYVLEKEQKEAQRKIIAAKGEAESIRIVKDEVARQGGTQYIQYLWAQKVPQNVNTMVVPGGTNLLVTPTTQK